MHAFFQKKVSVKANVWGIDCLNANEAAVKCALITDY